MTMPWWINGSIIDKRVVSCPPCILLVDVNTPAGLPDSVPLSHSVVVLSKKDLSGAAIFPKCVGLPKIKPEQFFKLLDHDKDVVSGMYKMSDNVNYATVENMDEDFFEQWAYYQFMQDKDIEAKNKKLFKVDYTGMGWMLVKYGVIEQMKYPWFHPRVQKHKAGWEEFVWDDVEFCMRVRDLGLDVWVDPTIIPGHEKTVVM